MADRPLGGAHRQLAAWNRARSTRYATAPDHPQILRESGKPSRKSRQGTFQQMLGGKTAQMMPAHRARCAGRTGNQRHNMCSISASSRERHAGR